jgi:hypothetical protein
LFVFTRSLLSPPVLTVLAGVDSSPLLAGQSGGFFATFCILRVPEDRLGDPIHISAGSRCLFDAPLLSSVLSATPDGDPGSPGPLSDLTPDLLVVLATLPHCLSEALYDTSRHDSDAVRLLFDLRPRGRIRDAASLLEYARDFVTYFDFGAFTPDADALLQLGLAEFYAFGLFGPIALLRTSCVIAVREVARGFADIRIDLPVTDLFQRNLEIVIEFVWNRGPEALVGAYQVGLHRAFVRAAQAVIDGTSGGDAEVFAEFCRRVNASAEVSQNLVMYFSEFTVLCFEKVGEFLQNATEKHAGLLRECVGV